jgi:hypothetical protein
MSISRLSTNIWQRLGERAGMAFATTPTCCSTDAATLSRTPGHDTPSKPGWDTKTFSTQFVIRSWHGSVQGLLAGLTCSPTGAGPPQGCDRLPRYSHASYGSRAKQCAPSQRAPENCSAQLNKPFAISAMPEAFIRTFQGKGRTQVLRSGSFDRCRAGRDEQRQMALRQSL